MIKRKSLFSFLFTLLSCASGVLFLLGQDRERPRLEENKIYRIEVPADRHWVSTGLDVEKRERIFFSAEGTVSLQKGNPRAYCDPDGYNLKTMQQPITDKNIGALIGRIVLLISIEEDEETGEEIRNEIIKEFFIGSKNEVEMPLGGELQLGINELVVEDNEGAFTVNMHLSGE